MADPIVQLHGAGVGLRRPPGPDPMAPIGAAATHVPAQGQTATYRPVEPCHVWVTTEAGRHPGLLLEWRKPHQLPWEGHVIHARPGAGGRWVQVDEWVLAGSIEKA
jgi:hypothetical protein